MDVLTDMLRSVQLRGSVFCRAEVQSPWGIRTTASRHAPFHAVVEGGCWMRVGDEEPLWLNAGDIALLPHGAAHSLSSDPSTPAQWLGELSLEPGQACVPALRLGGCGERTSIICGRFELERGPLALFPRTLPSVMVLRGDEVWLEPTLQAITREAKSNIPGSDAVVARLTDVLLVYMLRAWVNQHARRSSGWLAALADPHISRALSLLHHAPEHEWSVEELAANVGVSRSALFGRFNEALGEPPMRYLTRWRMHLAAEALRNSEAALVDVAEEAGYDSVSAFSRAFKRVTGQAPSVYRRARAS